MDGWMDGWMGGWVASRLLCVGILCPATRTTLKPGSVNKTQCVAQHGWYDVPLPASVFESGPGEAPGRRLRDVDGQVLAAVNIATVSEDRIATCDKDLPMCPEPCLEGANCADEAGLTLFTITMKRAL